jgi:hypothetical protein
MTDSRDHYFSLGLFFFSYLKKEQIEYLISPSGCLAL